MRHVATNLVIFGCGALGVVALGLLVPTLLGPDAVPDGPPLTQLIWLALPVLPPLALTALLMPRGRTKELGLFLLGWGCLWPAFLAYWLFGTITARLSGGVPPPIGVVSGPAAMLLALFFAVLPMAGLWLVATGWRRRRSERQLSPG